ncbi:hypothetical protein AVEN_250232-1 [Araneus ventricosus]|uniref:Uncharacterized protein n=1 Tax=Araneus ventricosus TaxID=182803 RepID=A0A4Y2FED6_ARAVE|nr:hypothetical protein AVEN_250232-1 [Araneus ventricosus]
MGWEWAPRIYIFEVPIPILQRKFVRNFAALGPSAYRAECQHTDTRTMSFIILRNRGGLVGRSWLRGQSVPGSSVPSLHRKSAVYVDLLLAKSYVVGQTPSYWCGVEVGEGAPA